MFLLALVGCVYAAAPIRAGWREVDAGAFVFILPTELTQISIQGEDSSVGRYAAQNMAVDFDYGAYSDALSYADAPEFAQRRETVDGLDAVIVSCRHPDRHSPFAYFYAIHFPKTRVTGVKLTVYVSCRAKSDYGIAEEIIRSIAFKPKPPNKALVPTVMSVTPAADAPVAPATTAAHL